MANYLWDGNCVSEDFLRSSVLVDVLPYEIDTDSWAFPVGVSFYTGSNPDLLVYTWRQETRSSNAFEATYDTHQEIIECTDLGPIDADYGALLAFEMNPLLAASMLLAALPCFVIAHLMRISRGLS